MTFDFHGLVDLPLECQRAIIDRLHWREVLALESTCSHLRDLVASDEHAWRVRCEMRFTPEELAVAVDDATTWRERFMRSVKRGMKAVSNARPLLDLADNTVVHFRKFEEAQRRLAGITFQDVREFIAAERSSPTLLVLAGMVECMAREPKVEPAEVVGMLKDAGCEASGKSVRLTQWLLGRLEGVGYRLRDEVVVHEGSLERLAVDNPRLFEVMLRGIQYEVRDMEVRAIGPEKKPWWAVLGTGMHISQAA